MSRIKYSQDVCGPLGVQKASLEHLKRFFNIPIISKKETYTSIVSKIFNTLKNLFTWRNGITWFSLIRGPYFVPKESSN
jgi:hypothetical protein